MEDFKIQKITVHISYTDEMTLYAIENSLHMLNEAMASFASKHEITMSKSNELSPKVTAISQGSFVVDVIIPIACSLLPQLFDIIKRKFSSRPDCKINLYSTNTRIQWTDEDNYELCTQVLKQYVLRQSMQPINDFLMLLSLSLPYSKRSIRMKLQNTKYLLENESISNTLPISPLPNCSKMHYKQFRKACQMLSIKF